MPRVKRLLWLPADNPRFSRERFYAACDLVPVNAQAVAA